MLRLLSVRFSLLVVRVGPERGLDPNVSSGGIEHDGAVLDWYRGRCVLPLL
jgi:hypothetical protein